MTGSSNRLWLFPPRGGLIAAGVSPGLLRSVIGIALRVDSRCAAVSWVPRRTQHFVAWVPAPASAVANRKRYTASGTRLPPRLIPLAYASRLNFEHEGMDERHLAPRSSSRGAVCSSSKFHHSRVPATAAPNRSSPASSGWISGEGFYDQSRPPARRPGRANFFSPIWQSDPRPSGNWVCHCRRDGFFGLEAGLGRRQHAPDHATMSGKSRPGRRPRRLKRAKGTKKRRPDRARLSMRVSPCFIAPSCSRAVRIGRHRPDLFRNTKPVSTRTGGEEGEMKGGQKMKEDKLGPRGMDVGQRRMVKDNKKLGVRKEE